MDIIEVKNLAALKDWHSVEDASMAHDFVALPADPIEEFMPTLEGYQPAGELKTFYVGYEGQVPVTSLTVHLNTLDNLDSASIEGDVHPDHRRRGLGRQLLYFAIDATRAFGRTRIFIRAPWAADESDGVAFPLLRSVGARQVLDDYRRVLDLHTFPAMAPSSVADGYQVVQWVDRAPESTVDGLAYLLHRMVLDAPMGEMDYEAEKWDASRYRDAEDTCLRRNRTRFTTVVVHEKSGEVSGMTDLAVNLGRPEVSYQWSTIVHPQHRGKRLGMALKAWNHRQVVDAVPQVRWINTWNATTNAFMVDVNEAMGFRIAERWSEWQLDL